MVNCPECGKNVVKSVHRIEAPSFKIEEYKCGNCGKRFRVIN